MPATIHVILGKLKHDSDEEESIEKHKPDPFVTHPFIYCIWTQEVELAFTKLPMMKVAFQPDILTYPYHQRGCTSWSLSFALHNM